MRRIVKRVLCKIAILAIFVALGITFFRSRYNAPIQALAQTQITNATSDLINDAVDRQIEAGDIHYDRIVYFEKDLNGEITALKTNMSEVNRLKTSTLNLINDEILALDTSTIGVRLGSIFLPEFLSGRGPAIPVEIISIRNSDASFVSNFTSAGINQTLHQISMSVLVDVSVLVLGETTSFTVSGEVVVAETIIVGNVPDTYLQTGGLYGSETENTGIDRPAQ